MFYVNTDLNTYNRQNHEIFKLIWAHQCLNFLKVQYKCFKIRVQPHLQCKPKWSYATFSVVKMCSNEGTKLEEKLWPWKRIAAVNMASFKKIWFCFKCDFFVSYKVNFHSRSNENTGFPDLAPNLTTNSQKFSKFSNQYELKCNCCLDGICPISDDFWCLRHHYAPWDSSYSIQFFFCGSLTGGVSFFCKIKLHPTFLDFHFFF